jgi:DNA invertase Pin-like site-specific DNA recombinase
MPITTKVYSYVRFSTAIQAVGASKRRQTENAERFVAERKELGWVLDKTLKLADLGVSAYKGKNVTEGALGAFLEAVREGKVAHGSVLLVENLDRISREQVMTALELFLGILRQGIRIVTLIDGQEYSSESLKDNPYRLIISLVSMIRAHEESAVKGQRVADAWERKRQAALKDKKPLTKQCPAWLTIKDGKYVKIEERVELVREMFRRMADGEGQGRIAEDFTRRGVMPWGGKKHKTGARWHDSYLQLIASNRAVLGEFQLHKGNGKDKRTPVGEPIKNYFPAIIPLDLFVKVNAAREARRIRGCVGRLGDGVPNLFQGLLYDGQTNRRCVYIDHGKWQYLTVPGREKGQKGWPYAEFEKTFLQHCRMLNWAEVFGSTSRDEVAEAGKHLATLRAQQIELDQKVAHLTEVVTTSRDVTPLVDKLRELQKDKTELVKAIDLAEQAHASALGRMESLTKDSDRIKAMASGGLTKPEERLRMREEIRRVVQRIDANFFPRSRSMFINYTNGAMRFVRPTSTGGAQIMDWRENGFIGSPREWALGAGKLPIAI